VPSIGETSRNKRITQGFLPLRKEGNKDPCSKTSMERRGDEGEKETAKNNGVRIGKENLHLHERYRN
jgi:hypothetical protein